MKKVLDVDNFLGYVTLVLSNNADMAELVDATDLKSVGTLLPCRFDPGFPHQTPLELPKGVFLLLSMVTNKKG